MHTLMAVVMEGTESAEAEKRVQPRDWRYWARREVVERTKAWTVQIVEEE